MALDPGEVSGTTSRLQQLRLDAGRLNALLGTTTQIGAMRITIAGVAREGDIAPSSLVITDVLDEEPNTAAFLLRGPAPAVGQELRITLIGEPSSVIFAGHLTQVDQAYELKRENVVFQCAAVDYTRLLNRRKVLTRYTAASASTIVVDLIATYTQGFTVTGVAASLPTVDEIDFTMEEVPTALSRLAKGIGGSWYVDYDRDVHFFLTETVDAPDAMTEAYHPMDNQVGLDHGRDLTQVRTRVLVEGGGANASVELPGAWAGTLPVDTGTWYSGTGGWVKSGPQRIAYTGKSNPTVDETGSIIVGQPIMPSLGGGTLVAAVAAGVPGRLSEGAYSYKVTVVLPTGESEPGTASAAVSIPGVSPPSAPTGGVVAQSGNLGVGTYRYKVTYETAAGETTASSASGGVTIGDVSALSAPAILTANAVPGNLRAGNYRYQVTCVTGDGESLPSAPSSYVTVPTVTRPGTATVTATTVPTGALTNPGTYYYVVTFITAAGETIGQQPGAQCFVTVAGQNAVALTNIPTSGDARVIGRRLYRSVNGSTIDYRFIAQLTDNLTQAYTDVTAEVSRGAQLPGVDTSGTGTITVTVPTSTDARVTRRILYRSEREGTTCYELTTLNDNTDTSFVDNIHDDYLGGIPPTVGTAGSGKIQITIPVSSDARVTRRSLYRTEANGSEYKQIATVGNNTATTFLDNVPDTSRGDLEPITNTAGSGQMNLSAIVLGPAGTTGRRLYRTEANGADYKFVRTISDNTTTTYVDNTADTSLGEAPPTVSEIGASVATTTLRVAELYKFPVDGWVRVGEQIIRYTGLDGGPLEGTLIGVPASGAGAILAPVAAGATVVNHPHLRGVTGVLYPIKRGDQVNVLAVKDDAAAQAALAAVEGGDGVHEHYVQDGRLALITAEQMALAQLALYSLPEARVSFATRDLKVRSGKSITLTLGPPTNLTGTFKIQRVVFSQFGYRDLYPLRTVDASSYLFTLDSLFRRLLVGTGSGV